MAYYFEIVVHILSRKMLQVNKGFLKSFSYRAIGTYAMALNHIIC